MTHNYRNKSSFTMKKFFSIIIVLKFVSHKIFSIIGAFIVIMGLYLLLWGKECDIEVDFKTKDKLQCYSEDPKCRI
jgi:hypothetical protein